MIDALERLACKMRERAQPDPLRTVDECTAIDAFAEELEGLIPGITKQAQQLRSVGVGKAEERDHQFTSVSTSRHSKLLVTQPGSSVT